MWELSFDAASRRCFLEEWRKDSYRWPRMRLRVVVVGVESKYFGGINWSFVTVKLDRTQRKVSFSWLW